MAKDYRSFTKSTLSLQDSAQDIVRFANDLGAVADDIDLAYRRAINKLTKWLRNRAVREVSRRTGLRQATIRQGLQVSPVRRGNQHSSVYTGVIYLLKKRHKIVASNLGMSRARQTPEGVTVGNHQFPGAFLARMRPGARLGIYERQGRDRFPVQQPRIPIREDVWNVLDSMAGSVAIHQFEKIFKHELNFLLVKRGLAAF